MEFVDPIRDIKQIDAMKGILQQHSQRDLLFFVLGINTGIKISDLLFLKVEDVWDGTKMKEFLLINDEKGEEKQAYYLNNRVNITLHTYLEQGEFEHDDYLFKSKKIINPLHDNKPIELFIMLQ